MAARKREQKMNVAMDRRLRSGMEQWARELVVFDGEEVRRLTEREVRIVAGTKSGRTAKTARRGQGATKRNKSGFQN
jgi:hypothetical protein